MPSADKAAGRAIAQVPTLVMGGDARPQMAPTAENELPAAVAEPTCATTAATLKPTATSCLAPTAQQAPNVISEAGANATLNFVTGELQAGRLSHAAAAVQFTGLIGSQPAGKLRCRALLNRAHCLFGLGRLSQALSDIDAIVGEQAPGVDVLRWHKVWMSRGGIHRKLAQNVGGDAKLYGLARADYNRVLNIDPPHEEYTIKARRCLEQLDLLDPQAKEAFCPTDGAKGGDSNLTPGGEHLAGPCRAASGLGAAKTDASVEQLESAKGGDSILRPRRLFAPSDAGVEQLESAKGGDSNLTPGGEHLAGPCRAASGLGAAKTDASVPAVAPEQQPAKRRRLRKSSGEIDEGGGAEAAVGQVAGTAVTIDAAFAYRSLRALGRDCASAGRALFDEGAVCEQRNDAALAAGGNGSSPEAASPPPQLTTRTFDVRSPIGGPPEFVKLEVCPQAGARDNKIGTCSCRLRGNCKHVAAALCAVEQRELRRGSGVAGSTVVGNSGNAAVGVMPLAQQGDSVALARRDSVERRLERRTLEELKGILRLNNQVLGGTKIDVLRRVADAVVFGALPQCPNCGGHLHPDPSTGEACTTYRCKKFNRNKEACGYEASAQELTRKPFIGAEQLW